MSGYVTDSRPISQTSFAWESGLKAFSSAPIEWVPQTGVYSGVTQDLQRTTSWRTRGGSGDDEAESFLRVTRNGFTTSDPVYDRGHEFYTVRDSVRLSHPSWTGLRQYVGSGLSTIGYRGPLVPINASRFDSITQKRVWNFPPERRLTSSEIKLFGARSISASAPTAPTASLSTALGELRQDGLPKYPGEALMAHARPRSGVAGEEFLNVTFGIAPLVADVKKTIQSLRSANQQIRKLYAQSGQITRRTFRFPTETSVTHVVESNSQVGGSPYWNVISQLVDLQTGFTGNIGDVQKSTFLSRDVYFKGAFTYYMPRDDSLLSRLERYEQEANKLLGTRLTVETLWNITPWSWLVDWFSDVGTVLSGATRLSEDGLVLRYGYLMSHVRDEVHYTSSTAKFKLGSIGSVTAILRRESKERVKATPFGFGVSLNSLSGRQWAILAALGLTKGDRRLR